MSDRRSSRAIVALAICAFVGLGLPEGSIGVAFPAIQQTFDQPLSALGLLLFPYSGGYILMTLSHGRVLSRLGTGRILVGAAGLSCTGALLYVAGPAFGFLMVGSFVLGMSAGSIDASLNSYVSMHLDHRVLAFMHAGFGVGATLGPLGVTTVLAAGLSWRVAYAVLAGAQIALAIGWALVRHRFVPMPAVGSDAPSADATTTTSTSSRSLTSSTAPAGEVDEVVAFEGDVFEAHADLAAIPVDSSRVVRGLNIMMFFLYVGTEAATGFLIATLLTSRGVAADTAGLLTTAYWASLTVGRLLTGAVGNRVSPQRRLLSSTASTVVGLTCVWVGGTGLAAVGLVVVGLSLGPVFPSLVSLTPGRVGSRRTSTAIGFQLAAASIGASAVPAAITVIAERAGPAAIAPGIFTAGLLLAAGNVVTGLIAHDLGGGARHIGTAQVH